MGLSPSEAERLEFREWVLWQQGHSRRERQKWRRSLSIINSVRWVVGEEPIMLDDFKEKGGASENESLQALKWRHQDAFEKDLTARSIMDKAQDVDKA